MKLFIILSCFIFSMNSYSENLLSILTPMLRLCISDEDDLEKTYEELTGQYLPMSVFDKIGHGKVEIVFMNDFDFKDQNGPDAAAINDDVGRTHGMKISIFKNIAPEEGSNEQYYINVSYETNLFTNSSQPEDFLGNYRDTFYWDDEREVFISDVYFKEENLFKVLLGKTKTYNAMYWKVGIGYQEINTEDISRGIILSSARQQDWFHKTVNEHRTNTFREYNYLEQDAGSSSGYVEFRVGKDQTLYTKNANRFFMRYGGFGRITNIKDATHIGSFLHIGYEHDEIHKYHIPAVRVKTGLEFSKYSKDNYSEYFFEVGTANSYFTTKLKYSVPLTDDPLYLNPLPETILDRNRLTPRQEPTFSLVVEGKIK